MDFSDNGERLVVGYENGTLIYWDVFSQKTQFIDKETHNGFPVLKAKMLDFTHCISTDLQRKTFITEIKKRTFYGYRIKII